MIPLLARVAAAGGTKAAEGAAARAALGARGSAWRQAMYHAGGDRGVASEMIRRKASDLREEERQRRQEAMDEARENARQMQQTQNQMGRVARDYTPPYAQQLAQGFANKDPSTLPVLGAQIGTQVISNDFRGIATSALPGPLARVIDAFGKAADAIEARGQELKKFSPDLASASANSFVRLFQANQYEGSVAGPEYARVIEELTELQATIQEDLVPLKVEFARFVADILASTRQFLEHTKLIPTIVDYIIQFMIAWNQFSLAFMDFLNGDMKKAAQDIGDIGKKIDESRRERAEMEALRQKGFDHIWEGPEMQLPEPGTVPGVSHIQPRHDDRFGFGIMAGF
jgi:hypothetical protein